MSAYLEVTGSGVATAPADSLDLYVGVWLVRAEVPTALHDLGDRVRALVAVLHEADVESVQTSSSSVGDAAVFDPDGESRPTAYRASQELQVRLGDPDDLARVLDAAVAAIGDDFRLQNLSWTIADQTELAGLARDAAFADARARAEQLAVLAGGTLGAVRRVTEAAGFVGPVFRLAAAKADTGFAAERGESRVEVSLTVRWDLDR